MSIIQVMVLAIIQGLTEFIPVSSSAHLILPGELLNWPDQGLALMAIAVFSYLWLWRLYLVGWLVCCSMI